ncbi:MAG: aspartate racemase/maleate isomerase family protein [Paracoccaceae bacterium]
MTDLMPAEWRPEHKLFTHQVGFTCPPFDWDAAPSDFLRIAPSSVGVHGWMLHVPDYAHGLDQRRANFGMMDEFCAVMARNGADVAAQVGSNWVHASGLGVDGIRDHCAALSDRHGVAFHMAGHAMVEALRDRGIGAVALNGAYHWPEWWQGTVRFLEEAGIRVLWAGNFVDQGWFGAQSEVNDLRWVFEGDLAAKSFAHVADKAPDAEAILINGMCNFRVDGAPRRPLHLTPALEADLGKPVIGHDTALYWRIFKTLGLRPEGRHGALLESL